MLSMFTTELMEKSTRTQWMKDESLEIRSSFLSLDLNGISKWHNLLFLALPRAVARFFVTRGIIARAEGTSLVGVWLCPPPEKFSNLEAPKSYFQHLTWDMSPKSRPRIWKWQTIASHYNQNNWVWRKQIHPQTWFVWLNRSRGGSCPTALLPRLTGLVDLSLTYT